MAAARAPKPSLPRPLPLHGDRREICRAVCMGLSFDDGPRFGDEAPGTLRPTSAAGHGRSRRTLGLFLRGRTMKAVGEGDMEVATAAALREIPSFFLYGEAPRVDD